VLDLKGFSRGSTRIMPTIRGVPPFAKVAKVDSVFIAL